MATPTHIYRQWQRYGFALLLGVVAITSCHSPAPPPKQKDIVKNVKEIDERIQDDIKQNTDFIGDNKRPLVGIDFIYKPSALLLFYKENRKPYWSINGKWNTAFDSALNIITHAGDYALNPDDYYTKSLKNIIAGTNAKSKNDAALWARGDLLMTAALVKFINHLRFSANTTDTVTGRKIFSFTDSALVATIKAITPQNIRPLIAKLEPRYQQYADLKMALHTFKAQYDSATWDSVPVKYSPTSAFRKALVARLIESDDYDTTLQGKDSIKLATAIKHFQRSHGLFPDGKAGDRTLKAMNVSPQQCIKQLAWNINRWRTEPDTLPRNYIRVNIPSFTMELWENDTARISSKVIIGKPTTPTPLLSSTVRYYIIYPYWTVPMSIIIKEMLPKLQRDTSYLRKNNMDVIDRQGKVVDAKTVAWKKLNKNYFPYKIRQRDGDENTLGIVKFNFNSKFGVYMHDTKERSLFVKDFRALSHGCIRLQQALPLAYYLVKDDSVKYPVDSLHHWFDQKVKKQVNLVHPVPIYIRYNTCEVKNGNLIFYDDLYSWQE